MQELDRHLLVLDKVTDQLCSGSSLEELWRNKDAAMPSLETLSTIMERLRAALFPGYFGAEYLRLDSLRYHVAANLDSIYRLLSSQILSGQCFACATDAEYEHCRHDSKTKALAFLSTLPEIRELLVSDAKAAYEGDPAASSPSETIFCYPSMSAMINHRIAHELYKLNVPIIPRIISEMAHAKTGIDIHPGAKIGKNFFIDHGTGVVIGETCIIGNNCRLYQGVTLGALSFPKNSDGSLVKGIARHPILEDNVTVYAGATILGRITVGNGSVIGGNVWLTNDVPANSRIVQNPENDN